MSNKYRPELTSFSNPILIIIFLGVTVFFGYMIGTLVLDVVFRSLDVGSIAEVVESKNSFGLLLVQGVTSLFAFLIGPYLFSKFYLNLDLDSFFKPNVDSRLLLFTAVLVVLIVPFNSFLVEWNANIQFPSFLSEIEASAKAMELKMEELVISMLSFRTIETLFLAIIVIGLIPAIGEEFLFRGLVQRVFLKNIQNPYLAILFVAILFSGFHLQFYGFFPRMMLGIVLGLIYYWSGNLIYSIIFHFLNNSLTVIFFYMYNIGIIEANIMDNHTLPYLTVIFSFVVTFVSLVYFRRLSEFKNESQIK